MEILKRLHVKDWKDGAKRIQANAKYLCPVGKPIKVKSRTKTGKVRKHRNGETIYKTVSKSGQLRNSIKTKSEATIDGAEAQVFVGAEYGVYVEFGTGERGRTANIDRPEGIHYNLNKVTQGQAPQPYLTPAYLYAKNNNTVEKEVEKTIQQEIRKLGGK